MPHIASNKHTESKGCKLQAAMPQGDKSIIICPDGPGHNMASGCWGQASWLDARQEKTELSAQQLSSQLETATRYA
jgi:hypothetical protein